LVALLTAAVKVCHGSVGLAASGTKHVSIFITPDAEAPAGALTPLTSIRDLTAGGLAHMIMVNRDCCSRAMGIRRSANRTAQSVCNRWRRARWRARSMRRSDALTVLTMSGGVRKRLRRTDGRSRHQHRVAAASSWGRAGVPLRAGHPRELCLNHVYACKKVQVLDRFENLA
jgi:hypothetical protein